MIDLQKVVNESCKLNDFVKNVENWRQNELQMICCENLFADLRLAEKAFRITRTVDRKEIFHRLIERRIK